MDEFTNTVNSALTEDAIELPLPNPASTAPAVSTMMTASPADGVATKMCAELEAGAGGGRGEGGVEAQARIAELELQLSGAVAPRLPPMCPLKHDERLGVIQLRDQYDEVVEELWACSHKGCDYTVHAGRPIVESEEK